MTPETPNGLVTVATVSQPYEATPIQILLGSNGIDSELLGENTVAANPLFSNAVGGIQIAVAAEDAERATELVEEHRRAEREAEAERARKCPQCGQEGDPAPPRPSWHGVLFVLTLGAFTLLFPWPRYACTACGHKWR